MRIHDVLILTVTAAAVTAAAMSADAADATPTPSRSSSASEEKTPIVITNETLKEYADKGNMTEPTGSKKKPTTAGRSMYGSATGSNLVQPTPVSVESMDAEAKKQYWRGTYEKQLGLIASLKKQIEVLDGEIPGLWRQFYAWDDPMYRDGVIKPKLDEALVRRQRMEEELKVAEARLPEILAEARKHGAEPGWFRGLDKPKSSS